MSKTFRLMVCCVALCSQAAHAAPMPVGMADLFRLADENSRKMKVYRTFLAEADEAVGSAKAQRRPDVTASVSVSYLGNGRIWDRHFSGATKVDIPHFGNNFVLEARQVVYDGGAIRSGIRLSELEKQMAALDLQRVQQDVRFLLVGYYASPTRRC